MTKQPATPINSAATVSPAIQDYLKACFRLGRSLGDEITMTQLAGSMEVAPPSVTNMVKRMEKLDLVARTPTNKLTLTTQGRAIALEVVRHHRLLETFLVNELGMGWAEAHEEAEVLEHYISERLEAVIDKRLANPTIDPHGEPIPNKEGHMPEALAPSLLQFEAGNTIEITQVQSQDSSLLQYLQAQGLVPGITVLLKEIAPFNGPLVLEQKKHAHHISREVAACIFGVAAKK